MTSRTYMKLWDQCRQIGKKDDSHRSCWCKRESYLLNICSFFPPYVAQDDLKFLFYFRLPVSGITGVLKFFFGPAVVAQALGRQRQTDYCEFETSLVRQWWLTVLGRQRQTDYCEFEASLVHGAIPGQPGLHRKESPVLQKILIYPIL